MTLKNFFKSILKMPYYKNYAAASGAVHNINKHEKAVEDQLLNHGFTEANLPLPKGKKSAITKAERNAALENPKILLGIKNNSYVSQPCGTHDSPDFIVNYNNFFHVLDFGTMVVFFSILAATTFYFFSAFFKNSKYSRTCWCKI